MESFFFLENKIFSACPPLLDEYPAVKNLRFFSCFIANFRSFERKEKQMGGRVPVPDDRTQKVVEQYRLEKKHLKKLWKCFRKYDADKSGTIDLEEFYQLVEEPYVFFSVFVTLSIQ